MTIRKRVSLSNILMIVIPVLLSVVICYVILFVFTRNSQIPIERAFPQALDMVVRYQRTGDVEELQKGVDSFNSMFDASEVYMAILGDNSFFYPEDAGSILDKDWLLQMLLRDGATGSVSVNGKNLIVEQVGEFRIIVVHNTGEVKEFRPPLHSLAMIFTIVLLTILCTNRLLTYILSRSITVPLNQLAYGAHQLGEGNLDYRIAYKGKDEFAAVSEAFNEMATHLQRLIEYQTKNEANRKELLAGISHDLRTPLTSIKAYVEGLLDGVAEDMPAQLKYLGIIRNKAEDIDHIVDKLFLFSKLDIGDYPVNPEKLNIGEELEAMARTVQEEYEEKGLTMQLCDEVSDVYIHMDPVYLHNVFVNILENSLRYKQKETCMMTVHCIVEELTVTVTMTDDGPGVREDELEKIFEVFYRGDPSRQNPSRGSGLGLAISAKMMGRIGGFIKAENTEEGGLRIILKFPRLVKPADTRGDDLE